MKKLKGKYHQILAQFVEPNLHFQLSIQIICTRSHLNWLLLAEAFLRILRLTYMYMYIFVTQTDSFTVWLALSPDPLKLVCELHT